MPSFLPRDLVFEFRKRFVGFDVGDEPHFDPVSLPFFTKELTKARRYLEFGAGGSTIMAVSLGKSGMTVESDRFYLRDVRRKLNGATGEMVLRHGDIGMTSHWGKPRIRIVPRPKRWRQYVETPFEALGGDFYDLVLVDGRFRVASALRPMMEAARRQSSLTLLVDDYANHAHYHAIAGYATLSEMAGRMAVFRIQDGQLAKVPVESDIVHWMSDYR
jgi:hypothetical protein